VYVDSKIIIEPTTALSKSEKDLVFKITREIPEEYASDPDNVQIVIRNF
jgi:ABC-type sugar transport system ATPase subunit